MGALRKIIEINEELCDGCGLCVPSCAEGAIQIIDGKAKLVSEVYCDGLGACLADCPNDALRVIEREAAEFDEHAVETHLAGLERGERKPQLPKHEPPRPAQHGHAAHHHGFGGCPGSALRSLNDQAPRRPISDIAPSQDLQSELSHWPVQLMLIPPHAPFLKDSDLLICADCVPFAVPDFHSRYLQGRALLVGCPKLDDLDHYRAKLKEIFAVAQPRSITVLKMEVPCCGGIAFAALEARDQALPNTPVEVHTIGIRGGDRTEIIPGGASAVGGGAY